MKQTIYVIVIFYVQQQQHSKPTQEANEKQNEYLNKVAFTIFKKKSAFLFRSSKLQS